jgi:hypothetical protein
LEEEEASGTALDEEQVEVEGFEVEDRVGREGKAARVGLSLLSLDFSLVRGTVEAGGPRRVTTVGFNEGFGIVLSRRFELLGVGTFTDGGGSTTEGAVVWGELEAR